MPARTAVQFEARVPDAVLRIPSHPVDLPSGAYFIWPFNLNLNGINLRFASAQLFTRLESASGCTVYFVQTNGISTEFAFDAAGTQSAKTSSGDTVTSAGTVFVRGLTPGPNSFIDLVSNDDKRLRIVLLKQEEAEDAPGRFEGRRHGPLTVYFETGFFQPTAESQSSLAIFGFAPVEPLQLHSPLRKSRPRQLHRCRPACRCRKMPTPPSSPPSPQLRMRALTISNITCFNQPQMFLP